MAVWSLSTWYLMDMSFSAVVPFFLLISEFAADLKSAYAKLLSCILLNSLESNIRLSGSLVTGSS